MKKWNVPEVSKLELNDTKTNSMICPVYGQCAFYLETYKDHDTGEGHVPGECPFTCPSCAGCTKPGNSPNHNQCPACEGLHPTLS